MNIIKEQADNLSAQIKVRIEESDYQNRVKKEINKLRAQTQVPGFRKGNAPLARIQSLYGHSILIDEINKILQESVGKFLEDEKMDILGAPFPAENTPEIDFDHNKDFEFYLNIVLQPEVNIDFLKNLPTTYYKIKATDAIVDEQVVAIRKQFSDMEEVNDAIQEKDYLRCDYQSIDEKEVTGSSFFFIDENIHPGSNHFMGHKSGDTLEIDLDKIYAAEPDKAGNLLNFPSEELGKAKGTFKFTITSVRRKGNANLDEDLFKKTFPNKTITTEAEFRSAIAEMHTQISAETVDIWFFNSLFDPIIESSNIQYPDNMLREYLVHQKRVDHNNQEHQHDESCDHCDEVSDEEFEKIKKGTSWGLIQNKIAQAYDVNIDAADLRQAAKEKVCRYFGADPLLDDEQLGYISGIVDNMMKEKEQAREFYTAAMDKKITQVLKEHTKIDVKEITWDEFVKIAEAKKKHKKTSDEAASEAKAETAEPKPAKKTSAKKTKKSDTAQTNLFEE